MTKYRIEVNSTMVVKGTMVILKSRGVGQINPVNVHFCHGWWIQMVFSDLILRMRNKILKFVENGT